MKTRLQTGLVLFATLALPLAAREGMWTPQQIPTFASELRTLGLQLDPEAFADLTGFPMGAIVTTGGCSASFVSPMGLIATNHHCVEGSLQFNSTPERDLLTNGFLAKTLGEEIQATPDARVWVTSSIEDVTQQMIGRMPKRITDLERQRTIDRRRKEMIAEGEKPGGVRVQVASFYNGAQFLRITSMEIRDVRLVYAPAIHIGNYGDEIDNWMWPRHTGDFGFYRAYVGPDGRPADFSAGNVPFRPAHWLKISQRDLDAGDLVIVAGYPGRTMRLKTAEEIVDAEQFEMPVSIRYRNSLLEILRATGAGNREIAIRNASRISALENILKKHEGTLAAFRQGKLVERKRLEEQALAGWFGVQPERGERYTLIEQEINRLIERSRVTRERDTLLSWLSTASPMLSQANTIWRVSVERTKRDLDRDDGYQERDWQRLRASLARAQRTIEPGTDRAGLRWFLLEATRLPREQRLTAIDSALTATGRESVESQVDAFLDRLYASTRIGTLDERRAMFDQSTKQLRVRNDAMLELAAALYPVGEMVREREKDTAGAMTRLRPQLLEGLRAVRGGDLYPDANSTLRVSFGTVEGYSPRNGVLYTPQTDVRGLLEKERGKVPFLSPSKVLERIRAGEFGTFTDPELGSLPLDFISTNDITNGSSGSATLNAWGELAGLAFDGNYEAMGSDYLVNPEVTRAIHVDSRYILWVMDAIDGAHNLLREMGVEPQFK